MLYAVTADGTRLLASPNRQAFCPGCRNAVLSKCGDINQWHWAHCSGGECDPWHEAETPWHTNWKMQFQEACREFVIGEHRADIRATRKIMSVPCVVELQHSPVELAEIIEREDFYGRMVWLLDGQGFKDHFEFGHETKENGGATISAPFRWKWFRKSWAGRGRPLFLDFGDCLWQLTDEQDGKGIAHSWTYHEFLAQYEETVGQDLPIHWRATDTGSLIYRFGQGHVLLYQRNDLYRLAVYRQITKKMDFRPGQYRTIEEAKSRCEPHIATLMKRN